MQSWKCCLLGALVALLPLTLSARAEDLKLEKDNAVEVSAAGAKNASMTMNTGAAELMQTVDGLTFDAAGKATISKEIVDGLIASLQRAQSATLELLDSSGRVVRQYNLIFPRPNGGGASNAAVADRPDGRRATIADCAAAASQWKANNRKDFLEGQAALLLFTPNGQYCPDKSTRVVRKGDDIFVGVMSFSDDAVTRAAVQFTPCDAEDEEPNLYISERKPSLLGEQAARGVPDVNIYDVRRCFNATTKVSVEIDAGGAKNKGERSINMYSRYRGTLQIGALYTDLHEQDFGLVDSGGQQLIYNKEPTDKGPEWIANVLVYGVPHYFEPKYWKKGAPAYKGRDIINDNSWMDRTGLIFTVGLDDPGDRFGVGLSFELAYGINVFYSKHWFRQEELVNLSVGDPFTGAVSEIPTRHEWETDASWGISFDLRYITALFDKK